MIKIKTHVGVISPEGIGLVTTHPLLREKLGKDFSGGWFWLEPHETNLLEALVEVGRHTGGLSFRAKIIPSAKLLKMTDYFQFYPKKLLPLRGRWQSLIEAEFKEVDLGGVCNARVLDSVPDGVEIKCPNFGFYRLLEGYGEIAVDRGLAFELIAISPSISILESKLNYGGVVLGSVKHAPPIDIDDSVILLDANQTRRGWCAQAGFLTLKSEMEGSGLFRMRDPLNATASPDWIATSDFLMKLNQLKVGQFETLPVFVKGSPGRREVDKIWLPYIDKIRNNPRNEFCIY